MQGKINPIEIIDQSSTVIQLQADDKKNNNMNQIPGEINPIEINDQSSADRQEDADSDQSKDEGVQSQSQESQNQQVDVLIQMIKSMAYVWAYFQLSAKLLKYVQPNKFNFIWNVYEHIKK